MVKQLNEDNGAVEERIQIALREGSNELDLGGLPNNPLTELPASLSKLTGLEALNVSENNLTVLPEWLGQLTQLQSLNLSHNRLVSLPNSLRSLTRLRFLDLSGNRSIQISKELRDLVLLETLDLSSTGLRKLPESLMGLKSLKSLFLSFNELSELPDWITQLKQLQELRVNDNGLVRIPKTLHHLIDLKVLYLDGNKLTVIDSIRDLKNLRILAVSDNQIRSIPPSIGTLSGLTELYLTENQIEQMPDQICGLRLLRKLSLGGDECSDRTFWGQGAKHGNKLRSIPDCIADLPALEELDLEANPLNPELSAAYEEGIEAVKRYLRAKASSQVALNEAKLILIGEGEVGKSCLLGALRNDPWEKGQPTTHGIEIKSIKVTDPEIGTEITLNGWDFGGQRVYRPTHQLFFSAPAVYLVVWKPREGPQQGFVKEWIKLVKHREPDAHILVVATHGGPKERQPDIDRQKSGICSGMTW